MAMQTSFSEALQAYFEGALELSDYMDQTVKNLKPHGFIDENTLGMIAICRDEITDPLYEAIHKHWGLTFNCCNLAGFVMMGKTGLEAAIAHTPIQYGVRRFVFYAMPHIAISQTGKIGEVYREGIKKTSHACGSLCAIVHELHSGYLKVETDMEDIEQSIVRQKILSKLKYGEDADLLKITKLAWKIISKDVEELLSKNIDTNKFEYVLMTGIQIHGPNDTNWIWPGRSYVQKNNRKEELPAFLNRG
ncbi:MAG: hypothetical protein AB4426_04095 [Xenococcaceae cyanobacterium]